MHGCSERIAHTRNNQVAILTHFLRSCNQVAIINCGTIGPVCSSLVSTTRNMAVANEKKQRNQFMASSWGAGETDGAKLDMFCILYWMNPFKRVRQAQEQTSTQYPFCRRNKHQHKQRQTQGVTWVQTWKP